MAMPSEIIICLLASFVSCSAIPQERLKRKQTFLKSLCLGCNGI